MIPKIRKESTRRLTETVSARDRKTGYPDRLTRPERKFLKKHPDWVIRVFRGGRSHARGNEIVRKMKALGLDENDVFTVHKILIHREMERKTEN